MQFDNLSGRVFGDLTAQSLSGRNARGQALWSCACVCGAVPVVLGDNLKRGRTTSCGCTRLAKMSKAATKHGMYRTPTYNSWAAMTQRCYDSSFTEFKYWGGRGIIVCERWRGESGFENFLADMGVRPDGKTLDRFPNNDGNYEPTNCRWATPVEQNTNKERA